MKLTISISTLIISLVFISCTVKCNKLSIFQQETTMADLHCNVKELNKKIVKERLNDSTDLIKAIKIVNTIRFYNLGETETLYLKFSENFNIYYYLKIYRKFDFTPDSTLTLYSKIINMHLYPTRLDSCNDLYFLDELTNN